MVKVAILTMSDSRKKEQDISGRIIKKLLTGNNFEVVSHEVIGDNIETVREKLIKYSDEMKLDVVLTTGGTGLGPRDITPEATIEVIDKQVPGISELIRIEGLRKTNRAMLSRGIAGTRKKTLIINLPGSPKGAKESLNVILDVIPHAIDMLEGKGHINIK
jgi:molybdenum cofactor synthesis domain-containing protein